MNTAMALPGVLCACALVCAGCSSSADSSATQGGALHTFGTLGGSGEVTDAGCSSSSRDGGIPAELRTCQADDDCVAVRQAGCCYNGWKVAVNRDEVDAYDETFACHQPRSICPMYIVLDSRVAECNRATQLCEMVAIDDIACGGFILHPHGCPDGYECVHGRVPDLPGRCVAASQ